MTVQNPQARADYDGNGAIVDFPVPFRFLRYEDLMVYRTDQATGAVTP